MAVFGNQTTTGAIGTGPEAAGGAIGGWAVMPEDGTITKISAYIQGHWQNSYNIVGFIAPDNGSETGCSAPAAGCVSQATATSVGESFNWYDFTLATPQALTAGNYWLGVQMEADACGLGYIASGTHWVRKGAGTYPNGSALSTAAFENSLGCIYATYTVPAGFTGLTVYHTAS